MCSAYVKSRCASVQRFRERRDDVAKREEERSYSLDISPLRKGLARVVP